jgi:hypothetical protein
MEQGGSVARREGPPCRECCPSPGDGSIDLVCPGARDLGHDLLGGRLDYLNHPRSNMRRRS